MAAATKNRTPVLLFVLVFAGIVTAAVAVNPEYRSYAERLGILPWSDRNRIPVDFTAKWVNAGAGHATVTIEAPGQEVFDDLTDTPWKATRYVDRGTPVSISATTSYLPPTVSIYVNGRNICTGAAVVVGEPSKCSGIAA